VAGYKAETGNFGGITVAFTESRVRVDLPGTYTLESGSPAEAQAAHYLDLKDVDVIVNGGEAALPEEPGYRSKQIVEFTREFVC
jgi:Fe2+ transport system protein B